MKSNLSFRGLAGLLLSASLAFASASSVAAKPGSKDPTKNPNAVPHQIDRSASDIQIKGWTPDLKYPLYRLAEKPTDGPYPAYALYEEVDLKNKSSSNDGYYTIEKLRCEIGFAEKEVLKNPKYECEYGVCRYKGVNGLIGVDPRVKVKACR